MYATDKYEEIMLNIARGISATAPAPVYLALFLSNPGDAGGGTEVSYAGYERKTITFSIPAASGNGYSMQNTDAITFAQANATIGNATHVGVFDSMSGGNMYLYGQLDEVLSIVAGVAPVIRAGFVKWTWTGKFSNAYKTKIMNLMRGTNLAGFTPYLALCNGSPEASGSEFSGNSYARTAMAFGAPSAQQSGSTMITNSARVETPVATGTWGFLTHVALYDASSNGEPYLIDSASIQTNMTVGRQVIYTAGTFNITVN